MKARLLIAVCMLLPQFAFSQEHQFKAGEAFSPAPDQAYVMARTGEIKGGGLAGTLKLAPILVRLVDDSELAQAQRLSKSDPDHWKDHVRSNVVELFARQPFAQVNGQSVLLKAIPPGTYILAGIAVVGWVMPDEGAMSASLCMGTVKFEAKRGVVTDLGEILAAYDSKPTDIPELAKAVIGTPVGIQGQPALDVAIRPASAAGDGGAGLGNAMRVPADYRAISQFPNYLGAPLSRLAPMAGVLDYDKNGDVLDLKATQ